MNSNEEYLDSLLKSIAQKEAAFEEMPFGEKPVETMPTEETAGDNTEELLTEEPLTEEPLTEEPLMEESLTEEPLMEELPSEEFLTEKIPSEDMSDMDLDALLESMKDNEDLAEIQDLFSKAENNEPVSDEVGQLLSPETDADVIETVENVEEETPKGKNDFGVKKKLKQFFTRKKKTRKEEPETESKEELKAEPETEMKEMPETELETQQETWKGAESQIGEEQNPEPQMTDESDIADISELLSSLENVGQESEFEGAGDDLFASAGSENELSPVSELLGDVASEIPKEKEAKDSFKEKKKDRKQGVFTRILQFLTEEDEEENAEEDTLSELLGGVETLGVTSDENQEVLAQLDKEDQNGKKKKKKRKKGDTEKSSADEDEWDEKEEPQEDKKKVKKEKKPKEPKVIEDSSVPKLSKKKVGATFLLAFTIMAAILVCCLFVPELFELKGARTAYYEGDFESCYRALYGKKLSESDMLMYERSEFMMSLQRRLEAYESYMAVDDELRALDALMQAVANQKEVLKAAEAQGLTAEAENSYQEILNMLEERYQLSEEEALKICAYKQDALYTLHLKAIVAGEEFVCPDFLKEDGAGTEEIQAEEESSTTLPEDLLPAEEELTETEFEEGITEP